MNYKSIKRIKNFASFSASHIPPRTKTSFGTQVGYTWRLKPFPVYLENARALSGGEKCKESPALAWAVDNLQRAIGLWTWTSCFWPITHVSAPGTFCTLLFSWDDIWGYSHIAYVVINCMECIAIIDKILTRTIFRKFVVIGLKYYSWLTQRQSAVSTLCDNSSNTRCSTEF